MLPHFLPKVTSSNLLQSTQFQLKKIVSYLTKTKGSSSSLSLHNHLSPPQVYLPEFYHALFWQSLAAVVLANAADSASPAGFPMCTIQYSHWMNIDVFATVARSDQLWRAHNADRTRLRQSSKSYCIVNDAVLHAVPMVQQTLLQFVECQMHPRLRLAAGWRPVSKNQCM